MRIEIKILEDVVEPYAVIYAGQITDEIQKIMDFVGNVSSVVTAFHKEKIVVLSASDIYMIRIEEDKAVIYGKEKRYFSKKRLYELEKSLRYDFIKISKTTLVNLKYIEGIESAFNGMMLLTMKNGCKDYISRKYLTGFKKYLGL